MNNISIRKFTFEDIPSKVAWVNNSSNNQYLHYDFPLEIGKTEEWFEKNKDRTDRYDATILLDGKPVGLIGLLTISSEDAEYYILLGETKYKGKGIAQKATHLILKHAFEELNLDKVYLYTETENIVAQKLFEKCGFTKLRVEENSAHNRGQLVDRFYYEITRQYFDELGGFN